MLASSHNTVNEWSRPLSATRDHGPAVGEFFDIGGSQAPCLLARSSHPVAADPENDGPFTRSPRRFPHPVGGHPIRDAFEKGGLREEIMNICQSSALDWETVGLYRQGIAGNAANNPPTIIITLYSCLAQAVINTARSCLDQIESLVFRQFPDVHVEIITCHLAEQYGNDVKEGRSGGSNDEFNDSVFSQYSTVPPGRSIGPAGTTGTGTNSGYVRVRYPRAIGETLGNDAPRPVHYAITCHHVAAFGRRSEALTPISAQESICFTSPAEGDHEIYHKNLDSRCNNVADIISERREIQKSLEDLGKGSSRIRRQITNLEEETDRLGRIKSHITETWEGGHSFGKVVLSSGIQQPAHGDGLTDWALVELHTRLLQPGLGSKREEERLYIDESLAGIDNNCIAKRICNKLCIPPPPPHISSRTHEFFSPHIEPPLVPKARIHGLCRSSDSEDPVYVYLRGRTTPFGVGMLHDTHDGIRIKQVANYDDKNKLTADKVFVSKELVVLDICREGKGSPQFSAKGDSGAPVRLEDGSVVGFVISSVNEEHTFPKTYVSVGETVMTSIAKALGADEVSFVGEDSLFG